MVNFKLSTRAMSYLIIGSTVYLFEISLIYLLQKIGLNSVLSVAISFWSGLVLSFILQKFVTFNDKRTAKKIVLIQVFKLGLLLLFNFLFTLALTKLLDSLLPAVICRTIALLITTIWNYYFYKHGIFNQIG